MAYQIDRYNGTPLVTVDDGTISNEKTTLKLVGKNYAGYGEIQNENFVFLTENFANAAPPANVLSGQVWFDSGNRKLKFWDAAKWRSMGGAEVSDEKPTGLTIGDLWWKTSTKQLFTYTGISDEYVLIGPQAVPGFGDTLLESIIVYDTQDNPHPVIRALVNAKTVFIINSSEDPFTLGAQSQSQYNLASFSYIAKGITMVNTTTSEGITSTNYRYWGTASNTDKFGGLLPVDYVKTVNSVMQGTAQFQPTNNNDAGFTVGANGNLSIYVPGSGVPFIKNSVGNNIKFVITEGASTKQTMQILSGAVDPGITDTYDIGEPALRWRNGYFKNLYADDFYGGTFHGNLDGISNRADFLLYAAGYRSATDSNTPFTIVARNASGNFAANVIDAIATKALYADLAERYEADAVYEPGTVVVFGGEKEITVTDKSGDHRVAGVVSTNPAYEMNVSAETEGFLPVALRGKVPVKVIGSVSKGDILVTSSTPGHAVSTGSGETYSPHAVVAKAIEDKVNPDPGVVMAVIV